MSISSANVFDAQLVSRVQVRLFQHDHRAWLRQAVRESLASACRKAGGSTAIVREVSLRQYLVLGR